MDDASVGNVTVLEPDVKPEYKEDSGDRERFSHYAKKSEITEALVMGTPVTALCGKTWIPSRDPERFPVCPECKNIWENGAFWKNGGDSGSDD
ncbi:MAG: DUF3039 domain-containing protein [Micrococcaceae bacterium]